MCVIYALQTPTIPIQDFSICFFNKLCRYKGWQPVAKSGELTLHNLQLYLQLPSTIGETGINNYFQLLMGDTAVL